MKDKRKRSINDIFSELSSQRPRIGDYNYSAQSKRKRSSDDLEKVFSRMRLTGPKQDSVQDQLAQYRMKHAFKEYEKNKSGGKRRRVSGKPSRRRTKRRTNPPRKRNSRRSRRRSRH